MRILHFADVHLDRPFVGLPPHAARRRREQLVAAFRRCLDVARERAVDLVTIGGDLWEEEHVRADTRKSVAYALEQLGIPVLIVCGNHDPLLPGGSYLRTAWPGNVTLASRRTLTEHRFDGVSLWAVSWGGGDLTERIIEHADLPQDGRTHLLLVHGTSLAAAFAVDDTSYMPFDPAVVARAGFALCLAGHIHVASHIERVLYPGSPEPLGWGEEGRHCVAVVDTRDMTVELVDVSSTRYDRLEIDCTGCRSSAEAEDRAARVLRDEGGEGLYRRVLLVGKVDPDCEISATRISQLHEHRYAGLVVEDRTEPVLDAARRAERRSLDGLFARKLQERLESTQDESERRVLELALQAGLRAVDGREVILRVD